ncbi:MAG TPA: aminotransferase class V-fold PLP-dependent enzyme [Thermomicrobiales bacterium]|nr:aminotransferase class V-fold PLP-dependent enzyme [Thermomicrobiales bacterium]
MVGVARNAATRDLHAELGLRRVINAAATLTSLGGSLMPPEVIEAMAEGARQFVDYNALHTAVGARIAEMTQNEAAFISSGAAAGVCLSVAASMTGNDPSLVRSFPDADAFPRNEVLVYRSQRNGYDYAASMTGARLIDVDADPDTLRDLIGERTAAVLWFAGTRLRGDSPPIEQIVAIAHEAGVPIIVDAAAQIPPVANLWHFTREVGADIAIFSGGKGLRGPQSSGLVLGRQEIIDAIRLNASPNYSIGRPMKVGKEELFGIFAAVEWTLAQDEPAIIARYEEIVRFWLAGLDGLPGVEFTRGFPSEAGQPHARVIGRVLPGSLMSRDDIHRALWERDPAIAVLPEGDDLFTLNPQTIEPGEEVLVLEAVQEVLREH